MVSFFSTTDKMRLNLVQNFLVIVILFGSVIQARWSRTLPRSENKEILKITRQTNKKSRTFSSLPKEFQNKSNQEIIMEKYCLFLLGAYKECMEKYLGFKLRKVQKNEEKQYRRQNTSTSLLSTATTSSPLMATNEKIYVRI